MNTNPTTDEILRRAATSGIVSYLYDLVGMYDEQSLESVCEKVVELVNSGQVSLLCEVDFRFLDRMTGPSFFPGMRLLCSIVPFFEIECEEVLKLVEKLVERAGNDFAANEPFRAFRTWCSNHPSDARLFVDDVRSRDDTTVKHVTFAFEGLNDGTLVIDTLKTAKSPNLISEASTALGRMKLTEVQASEAIIVLAAVASSTRYTNVCANALLSCYAILGNHDGIARELPQDALKKMTEVGSNESLNVLATLICNLGSTLSACEWELVIDGLKDTTELIQGNLESIDHSALEAKDDSKFFILADLIRHLICKFDKQLCLKSFPCFKDALFGMKPTLLGKILVHWIMNGNTHLYKTLSTELSSEISRPIELKLESDDLPSAWYEQLFLCRKVVGWFYSSPITATSFLVAVLQHGTERISDQIVEMLEYPLLLSYYEKVSHYLENEMHQYDELLAQRLQPILDRTKDLIRALRSVEEFPELKPNEIRQHFRAYRDHELMKIGWKSAQSQSILHGLVKEKHQLYGTTSATGVIRDDGEYEFLTTKLETTSIAVDYPLLDVLDHTRVNKKLLIYRHEHRAQSCLETDT